MLRRCVRCGRMFEPEDDTYPANAHCSPLCEKKTEELNQHNWERDEREGYFNDPPTGQTDI